ncbi:hypothetical protein ACB098_11G193600 [Castanea mollissima]
MDELPKLIVQHLLVLCTTVVLPMSIWILCCCNIFSNLRGFTPMNYQERVRENLENTIMERIAQLLDDLFPQYGLTPSMNTSFSTIIHNLLNQIEEPAWLTYISNMYNSLVENGIENPFFHLIVQAFLTMMGGEGGGV